MCSKQYQIKELLRNYYVGEGLKISYIGTQDRFSYYFSKNIISKPLYITENILVIYTLQYIDIS